MKEKEVILFFLGIIGGMIGLSLSLIDMQMRDKINERVPDQEKVTPGGRQLGISKKYRTLYPDGKLYQYEMNCYKLGLLLLLGFVCVLIFVK